MKLVASLLVRNELGRYLEPCIDHLLGFCDELRVLDDRSTDGTFEWLIDAARREPRIRLRSAEGPRFFEHEGVLRQELLDWTLDAQPTHVLAVDADELIADGPLLRARLEAEPDVPAWSLCMAEVWGADEDGLVIREDGGWRSHPVPILWRVGPTVGRIADRALACGRVPQDVDRAAQRAVYSGVELLHFGWANPAERAARHARYVEADGGRFHASGHLRSIAWPEQRWRTVRCEWPAGVDRAAILARLTVDVAAA